MTHMISTVDRGAIYRFTPSHFKPAMPGYLKKTKCPYLKIRNTIWSVVKWIFKKIASLFFHKSKRRTNRVIALREFARNLTAPSAPVPKTDESVDRRITVPSLPDVEKDAKQQFHDESLKFIDLVVENEFEKKIKPALTGFDESLTATSDLLKFGADIAISVGDKAAKPIFKKLKKFKVEEKIQPDLKHLLDWLLKDETKEDLERVLREKFEGKKEKVPFLQPTMNWLFSTHDQSLSEVCSSTGIDVKFHEKIIEKMFEESMQLLVGRKIRQYTQVLQEKLGGRLPEIMHKTLADNVRKISGVLIDRGLDLISTPKKYTSLFDSLTHTFIRQTEAVIHVEEAKKRTRKSKEPEKAEENGLKVYSQPDKNNFNICLPGIARLVNEPDLSTEEKEEIELQFFEDAVAKILPMFLPKQRVTLPDGEQHDVDGMVSLLNQIEIPDECREIFEMAREVSKEILSPETQEVINTAFTSAWEIAYSRIEEIVIAEAKKEAQRVLAIWLKNMFEKLVSKKSLDVLMAKTFLPAMQRQILRSMARELLLTGEFKNMEKSSTLVKSGEKGKDEARRELYAKLYEKTKEKCHQFSDGFAAISPEEYQKIIEPMIEDMAKEKNLSPTVPPPPFGKLIVNLLKDIGEFKCGRPRAIFWSFLEDMAVSEIPISLGELRESPELLVELVTRGIRENYSTKEDVERLLSGEVEEGQETETEGRLKEEISKTAKLAYDLIHQKAEVSTIAKYGAKWFLGSDTSKLDRAIANIYSKTFGNRTMNLNLLLCVQESAIRALDEANQDLQKRERQLEPTAVEQLPTLIPESLAKCL